MQALQVKLGFNDKQTIQTFLIFHTKCVFKHLQYGKLLIKVKIS